MISSMKCHSKGFGDLRVALEVCHPKRNGRAIRLCSCHLISYAKIESDLHKFAAFGRVMQDISRLLQEQLNRFLKIRVILKHQFNLQTDRIHSLCQCERLVMPTFYVTTCCQFFEHLHAASWNKFAALFHVSFFEVPESGLSHCKEEFQGTSLKSPFGRMLIDSSPSKLGVGAKLVRPTQLRNLK